MAKQKAKDDLRTVAVPAPPIIPACNRWLKVFPPIVFWMLAIILGIAGAIEKVAEEAMQDYDQPLTAADIIGPGDDDTYQKKRFVARRQSSGWGTNSQA